MKEGFYKTFVRSYKDLYDSLRGKNRSSPLKAGHLKAPGDYTDIQLYKYAIWLVFIIGIISGMLGGAPIMAALSSTFGVQYLYAVLFLFAVFLLLLCPVIYYQMKTHLLGHRGERIVADALGKCLRQREWQLFHSAEIPNFGGDIDHIIVGPKGVFCVETKNYRIKANQQITIEGDKILFNGRELPSSYGNPTKRTKKAAIALRDFLQKQQCPFVQFVKPIILFADDTNSSCYFSENLIVGKSSSINKIFKEIESMKDKLTLDEIDAIGKVLEEQNRVSMDT